jgi:hypothetical protein
VKTNRSFGLLLGFLSGCHLSAFQPDGSIAEITIRVVNSAKVSPAKLTQAEQAAAHILRMARVALAFEDCSAGSPDERSGPCASSLGASDFWLHVATWKPSIASGEMLGFTTLGKDTGNEDTMAGIYYPMVKNMAENFGVEESAVLGAALAHEIGHLLGVGHSPVGIMRPAFGRNHIVLASAGGLLFSEPQAVQIRIEIDRRHGKP